MNTDYDIIIIGGGPAGSAAALTLCSSDLKVALVDRSEFPRHKTCGDAIPGKTQKYLREIWPEIDAVLEAFPKKSKIKSAKVFGSNGHSLQIDWVLKAYNIERFEFDNILFQEVKSRKKIDVYENFPVKEIEKDNQSFKVKGPGNKVLKGNLLIGADGANSIVAKLLSEEKTDRESYGFAVAQYFEGVDCPEETNLAYILKDYLPGYFWVFPIGGNKFNVGFGLVDPSGGNRNLKNDLSDILKNEASVRKRFKNAKALSSIYAFGLPMGGKNQRKISGERFLLCGDAAYLIDPLQGHGIDKAVRSGIIAARVADEAVKENDFTESKLKNYQEQIYREFDSEFKRNFKIMSALGSNLWILNGATRLAKWKPLRKAFSSILKI